MKPATRVSARDRDGRAARVDAEGGCERSRLMTDYPLNLVAAVEH